MLNGSGARLLLHVSSENHTDRTPAVEGVEQAHHAVLVFKGAGFDNGADQNFDQSAADGVQYNGDQDSRERMEHDLRQKRHQDKSQCGQNLRSGNADTVADAVSKFRGGKIHQKLGQVEDKRNQRDFFEGDSVGAFECQKQKRRKVRGNRLGDESEISGDLRFL